MNVNTALHTSGHGKARHTPARTLEQAVEDRAWLGFEYHGRDVTLIPVGVKGDLLQGIKADTSEFRTYKLGQIEEATDLGTPRPIKLRRHGEVVDELKAAIAHGTKVEIDYSLPGRSNPITLSIDPEGFVKQPDSTIAVEALSGDKTPHTRHFRLDRILGVHAEE